MIGRRIMGFLISKDVEQVYHDCKTKPEVRHQVCRESPRFETYVKLGCLSKVLAICFAAVGISSVLFSHIMATLFLFFTVIALVLFLCFTTRTDSAVDFYERYYGEAV